MATNPTPFSAKSASADQTSFEAKLAQQRLFLRQNHLRCEDAWARLHTLSAKLFGWGQRNQLLTMIDELAALGEKLSGDLQEAPIYFKSLDGTLDRQVKDEIDRMTLMADALAGVRILTTSPTILHPSSGQLGTQNDNNKHAYRQTIRTATQVYNQKIRQMQNWRRKGMFRLIRMWLADIPTCNELPQLLDLH